MAWRNSGARRASASSSAVGPTPGGATPRRSAKYVERTAPLSRSVATPASRSLCWRKAWPSGWRKRSSSSSASYAMGSPLTAQRAPTDGAVGGEATIARQPHDLSLYLSLSVSLPLSPPPPPPLPRRCGRGGTISTSTSSVSI
eukprot:scaffold138414_cov31-Tisochrysis_lutea.AAC.2